MTVSFPWYQMQTKILPKKKKKKRISQANITDEHRFKIHQIESSNILKGSYTIIKGDLSQGCKDLISTNQSIWYTTLTNLRIKTTLIISIDAEKAFDKIQHLFVTGKKKKNLSLTKFLHGLFFLMKNFLKFCRVKDYRSWKVIIFIIIKLLSSECLSKLKAIAAYKCFPWEHRCKRVNWKLLLAV